MAVRKYDSASPSDKLIQPFVTLVLPCWPTVLGLAWMNSPLLEIRTAKRS
ncbi:Uncharacterised protein [Mycobacteroides abscessus subsp. massiliense]|nr:Uncharacterised protein [Mycobacteroides abscessus subsp. massiliense]